jgi:hypothetical protein
MDLFSKNATVVLVHGASADGIFAAVAATNAALAARNGEAFEARYA